MRRSDRKLYVALFSIHGLIRSSELELGRDADTGGQTTYVVELARALADHPRVERVDLFTRRVHDSKVDDDYAREIEPLADRANIIRIDCGPKRYLRKESLWPHLPAFIDNTVRYFHRLGRKPDIAHGHYADAGRVATELSLLLGVPLVFTGHSLGRTKKARLLEKGLSESTIESRYHISTRIEAEETTLDHVDLVVTSTRQEVDEQYSLYRNHCPERMRVIPPGVDLERFRPPGPGDGPAPIQSSVERFLREPDKPPVLAILRPDERKNLPTLVRAYANNEELRELSNLVVVAGTRDDVREMEKGPRKVLSSLLFMIDRYDLYGSIAYPKQHDPEDVPDLYRMAARRRGVFINPALTEPFGLTLIESAASGLPIVATHDGGPTDIIDHCRNGMLIDPLDEDEIGKTLVSALSDEQRWDEWARNGFEGAHRHYSWTGHVQTYVESIDRLVRRNVEASSNRLLSVDRMLVCDIDNTLLGDDETLEELVEMLERHRERIAFAVATGRRVESAVEALKSSGVPTPDIFITSVGSEINYGYSMLSDNEWRAHLLHRWDRDSIVDALKEIPGLVPQPDKNQRELKVSYYIDSDIRPRVRDVVRHLRERHLPANVIFSHDEFLDVLPIRASKGLALEYVAWKWGISLDHMLVAGDSGNDAEMLRGTAPGVVVGNYSPELEGLRGEPGIYFARASYAGGVLEGIRHYEFLGSDRATKKQGVKTS